MFEVDWADYDCERVGQRRARKEVERERKKKEDASSHHETISTRTSCSSDQHHRSFFGSLTRKKTGAGSSASQKQEATNPRLSTAAASSKRSSLRIHRASATTGVAASIADGVSIDAPTEMPAIHHSPVDSSTGRANRRWPETPDRSSNGIYQAAHKTVLTRSGILTRDSESMLSKMTQLTIPMSESQGDGSITTKIVQALDEEGSFVTRTVKTTGQPGRNKPSPWIGVETRITSGPKTSENPREPPPSLTPSSPDNTDKSASELIDDWFVALHGQARKFPRPAPGGAVRRGNVFLPPNLARPLPTTPTRRSARRDGFLPPSHSPIRFLPDDPDDWKTPEEWNRLSSTKPQDPANDDSEAVAPDDKEAALDSVTSALSTVSVDEEVASLAQDSQKGQNPPGLPVEKLGKASPVYCQFQWKSGAGARGKRAT